jgi:mannose-6-phosphate isomerase-like protein (cupin superfamily)
MPHAGDVLDLSPIGAIFHVRKTAEETQGRSFEMEWELLPRSGGTPVHVHPHATESYEVLTGELDLYVDGVWRRLAAGQAASVNPGVPHTFRNATDASVRVYNIHAPAMKYGEYFEGLHRVVSSGAVPPGRMTLKAVLYLSMLMTSFRDEIQSVKPPQAVMSILALVARSLGYRVPPSSAAPGRN